MPEIRSEGLPYLQNTTRHRILNLIGLKQMGVGLSLQPEDVGVGQLFWVIRDAVIVGDVETGQIALWNPAASTLFGYSAEEIVGRPIEVLMPPHVRERHRNGLARYREHGHGPVIDSGRQVEVPAVRKSGEEITVELSLAPLGPHAAEGRFVVAVVRDVTKRKQAEAQIVKSQQQIAEALRIAQIGNWEWDIQRNIVTWSDELYQIFGLTRETFNANLEGYLERIHPDDRQNSREIIERAYRESSRYEVEHRIIRADGTIRTVHGMGAIVRDEAGQPVRVVGTTQDITERKRAEEQRNQLIREQAARAEVEAARRQLHNLFMKAPACIAEVRGPEHVFELVNPLFLQTVGRHDPHDLLGKPVRTALPELADQGYFAVLDQVYATGQPFVGTEMPITIDRDGNGTLDEDYFNFVAQPLVTRWGAVNGILIHAVEVTALVHERRRVEELAGQLETERAQLEAVLRQMPGGLIIAAAPSGELILGNEQVEQGWRHPFLPADSIGQFDGYKGFHSDGTVLKPEEWPLARSITTGEVVEGEEITIQRGDGTPGTIRMSSAPIKDRSDRIVAGVVTFYDISEQKRIKDTLQLLAEAGEVLTSSLDYETTLASVTRLAVPRLADWCAADLVTEDGQIQRLAVTHVDPAKIKLAFEIERRFPPDPDGSQGVPGVIRTGQPVFVPTIPDEWLAKTIQDAEQLALMRSLGLKSVMIVPLIARGRTLGALSFALAESGRHYDRDDLAMAIHLARRGALAVDNARLYREAQEARARIAAINTDLARQADKLAAANKELESFSYSVSHDLRAPLRAIDGFSRILLEEYESDLPPEAQRYLGLVRQNADQMGQLIDDLLQFSRLSRKAFNWQDVRPGDLIRDVLADLGPQIEQRQVAFSIADLPPCRADPALLRQVFANLLANALKFTQGRPVATIEIGHLERDGECIYFVKDNGVGFDMRYADKLFGVFQRLHRTEDYEGTGVGLATVQRIIDRHGGRIWADAAVDRGATFYFTLGGRNTRA